MYDVDTRATMLFDVPCRVEDDSCREEREVWKGVIAPLRAPIRRSSA